VAYSRFHKSRTFCGTCHDVSNPVLANLSFDGTPPGDGSTVLPTEDQPAHGYFAVERTFSEFMLSDFGLPGGAPGEGPFDPAVFDTSRPGDVIASCQDCHMADAPGRGCSFSDSVDRPAGSVEHPASGQPVHEMVGGNVWVPWLLASAVPGSANHDPINEALLDQGAAVLTMSLDAGIGLFPEDLLEASASAGAMLEAAATLQDVLYEPASGALSFRLVNHTGHKLITGYPEGRRMFVSVELWAGGAPMHVVNPYDISVGTLKGLDPGYSPDSPLLDADESHVDELVYEAHSSSTMTGEDHTFHFALADGFARDNRIPPRGFRIGEAAARLATPAWGGQTDPGLFTAAEYAGGWDDVLVVLPTGADAAVVTLWYQTVSREYAAFLRDEIEGTAATLASPTPSGEAAAYIAQTDPFFDGLSAWGDTIWQLWLHNKDVPGAAPYPMAQAGWSGGGCAPIFTEVCDGLDNDCDGLVDDADPDVDLSGAETWFVDADGDGHGDPAQTVVACALPAGASAVGDDCDDNDPARAPSLTEDRCDGVDHDCDGAPGTPEDGDGDGFDECVDCEDADAGVNPGAQEVCGGGDEDCDGLEDEEDPDVDPSSGQDWYPDDDGDGFGANIAASWSCEAPEGSAANNEDCDDGNAEVSPGADEIPDDGIDNDCDGEDASTTTEGCACATGPPGSGGWSVLFGVVTLAAVRRRRR